MEEFQERAGGNCQASGGLDSTQSHSSTFYWPKQVARPHQIQGGWEILSFLAGGASKASRLCSAIHPLPLQRGGLLTVYPSRTSLPVLLPSAFVVAMSGGRWTASPELPLPCFPTCLLASLWTSHPGRQSAGFLSFHSVC